MRKMKNRRMASKVYSGGTSQGVPLPVLIFWGRFLLLAFCRWFLRRCQPCKLSLSILRLVRRRHHSQLSMPRSIHSRAIVAMGCPSDNITRHAPFPGNLSLA